jgi:hypothetical protein
MAKLRVLVAAGGVVAGITLAAAPAAALGPLHHQTLRASVSGKVTSLVVRGDVGDIKVVPGITSQIVAVEQYNFAAPKLTHSLSDGVLRVSAPCPESGSLNLGLNDCSVDFVITVPSAVTVDALDDVGGISVRGLSGHEQLHTDVGEVLVNGVSASSVLATASAGTVRLQDVSARALTLRSDTGGVVADLSSVPQSVVARSSDGDVNLTVPAAAYALHVHTDVGSQHVTGIIAESDAPRSITASSDDGDVRITGR